LNFLILDVSPDLQHKLHEFFVGVQLRPVSAMITIIVEAPNVRELAQWSGVTHKKADALTVESSAL
jgi:hypothetical protein